MPLIQYQETDWAFTKRLASHFFTSLIPDTLLGHPKFYVGLKQAQTTIEVSSSDYSVGFSNRYFEIGGELLGFTRDCFRFYKIRSLKNLNIGDNVILNNLPLQICRKEASLTDGELIFIYTLSRDRFIAQHTAYIGDDLYVEIYDYCILDGETEEDAIERITNRTKTILGDDYEKIQEDEEFKLLVKRCDERMKKLGIEPRKHDNSDA